MSGEHEVAATSSGLMLKNSNLVVSSMQSFSTAGQAPSPPSKRKRSSLDIKSLQAASFPQGQAAPSNVYRVGFVGAGNMARAIAEGMIASGQVSRSSITASATNSASENLKKMKEMGVNVTTTNQEVILNSDLIVLAVKPYQIVDVMKEIHDSYTTVQQQAGSKSTASPRSFRPLVVSVAAAVTLAEIEERAEISWIMGGSAISGHLPVVRCLPTVASSVRAGVTVYTRGRFCNDADVKPFLTLFSLVGHCEEVPEKLQDSFAAFSGSGIAFMSVVLEGMADGGVMVGIPRATSQRIAAHTMMSAASLVLQKGIHPAQVKDSVASPGGTTIYGLSCMERGGVRALMMDAVKTATDRAGTMNTKPNKS